MEEELDDYLKHHKYNIFTKIIVSPSIESGLLSLMQSCGLGGLQPNTVIMGWPSDWQYKKEKANAFVTVLEEANSYGHFLTLLKPAPLFDNNEPLEGNIDIWSIVYDGGILLMLAHILLKSKIWRKCTLRLFTITPLSELRENEEEKNKVIKLIRNFLRRFRLQHEIAIEIVAVDPEILEQHAYKMEDAMDNKEKAAKEQKMTYEKKASVNALMTGLHRKEIEIAMQLRRKRELTKMQEKGAQDVILLEKGENEYSKPDEEEKLRNWENREGKIVRCSAESPSLSIVRERGLSEVMDQAANLNRQYSIYLFIIFIFF